MAATPLVASAGALMQRLLEARRQAGALSEAEAAIEAADESFQVYSADLVYGELLCPAFLALLADCGIAPTGTFLDIGSGEGGLVCTAALTGLFATSIGVELIPRLHRAACRTALHLAECLKGIGIRHPARERVDIFLFNQDFADAPCEEGVCRASFGGSIAPSDMPLAKELVPSDNAVDVALVNGLCFEPETHLACMRQLLQLSGCSSGGRSRSCWHVRIGGLLLLTTPLEECLAGAGKLPASSQALEAFGGDRASAGDHAVIVCRCAAAARASGGADVAVGPLVCPPQPCSACGPAVAALAFTAVCDTSWGRPVSVHGYWRCL